MSSLTRPVSFSPPLPVHYSTRVPLNAQASHHDPDPHAVARPHLVAKEARAHEHLLAHPYCHRVLHRAHHCRPGEERDDRRELAVHVEQHRDLRVYVFLFPPT